MELPQLWIAGRWHERFNMPPDPRDYGSGHRHTQAQVDAFAVTDKQMLMDYLDAVFDRTKAYLANVTNEDKPRSERAAVSAASHTEHPARQRHQLQHAPCWAN